jgi:hypothetical protein
MKERRFNGLLQSLKIMQKIYHSNVFGGFIPYLKMDTNIMSNFYATAY